MKRRPKRQDRGDNNAIQNAMYQTGDASRRTWRHRITIEADKHEIGAKAMLHVGENVNVLAIGRVY